MIVNVLLEDQIRQLLNESLEFYSVWLLEFHFQQISAVFPFIITPRTDFVSTRLCLILWVQICLVIDAYCLSPLVC